MHVKAIDRTRSSLRVACVFGTVFLALIWTARPSAAASEEQPITTPAMRLCAAWDAYLAIQIGDFTASGMVAADTLAIAAGMREEARELCASQRVAEALKRYREIAFPIDPTIP